jgi:hypothetical protein
MAQPFRAYAKTLLERQHYPVRRPSPGANAERPYDVAGWTLPYQMGIDVIEVADPFSLPPMEQLQDARILPSPVAGHPRPTYYSVDARGNGGSIAINRLLAASLPVSWRTDGTLVVPSSRRAGAAVTDVARELGLTVTGVRGRLPDGLVPISRARVGLYRPWVESIDEGWTRWLLERYEFPYTTVTNHDVRHGALATRFDVIVLPDITAEGLLTGYRPGTLPDEYTGGIGAAGVEALRTFVEEGGTLVALDSSTALAIDALKIPVRNVVRDAAPSDFFCPGSILRLEAETSHPLAFGMQPRTAAFFAYSSAFEVTGPPTVTNGGAERAPTIEVVARYGASDLLMSGWIEAPGAIAGRAAVIAARVGRGRAVLIGFRAQHRAQTHATFRLLFNAIHTSGR